jgi:hypothetical protein
MSALVDLSGKRRGRKLVDLSNQRFERWRVIGYVGRSLWACVCDCGTHRDVHGPSLRNGLSRSCRCLMRERTSARSKTHGMTGSAEYRIWRGIKARCFNPNVWNYHNYGGRGISVCQDWCESFDAFLADMGPRPPGLSIDRVDPYGDYEPGNVRWASPKQQANNRRKPTSHRLVIRMRGTAEERAAAIARVAVKRRQPEQPSSLVEDPPF